MKLTVTAPTLSAGCSQKLLKRRETEKKRKAVGLCAGVAWVTPWKLKYENREIVKVYRKLTEGRQF